MKMKPFAAYYIMQDLKITGCVFIISFWVNLISISLQNIGKQG